MNGIYLDNNASTPVLPAVWEAMQPFYVEYAGNPASSHRAGRQARQALENAREHTAALLDAAPDEGIFTSGATEANNLALFGLVRGTNHSPVHIVSSPIEHTCVTEPLRQRAEGGHDVQLMRVRRQGIVEPPALAAGLRPTTALASVMLANHETGAVQPIEQLTALVNGRTLFNCDAAAAAG